MYILFLILGIIFNGAFTTEIFLFGLGVSLLIYLFACKFMDYSLRSDLEMLKKVGVFFQFMGILLWEIIKANVAMAWMIIIKQEYELHPVIVKYNTSLKSDACKSLLANSITLTPGTITISISANDLIIHAIDESLVFGSDGDFVFEKILKKLEGGAES